MRVTTGGDDTYGAGNDADTGQTVTMSTAGFTETFECTLPSVSVDGTDTVFDSRQLRTFSGRV